MVINKRFCDSEKTVQLRLLIQGPCLKRWLATASSRPGYWHTGQVGLTPLKKTTQSMEGFRADHSYIRVVLTT